MSVCVFILGMHRSGTSCLAGITQAAGVFLGEVHTQNPHNAKGNRENPRVMQLNNSLLEAVGASWDNPDITPAVAPLQTEQAQLLAALRRAADSSLYGLKDPRLAFTVQSWISCLGGSPAAYLVSFRNPMSVARSLQARNGFSIEQGLHLWCLYNRRLLDLAAELPLRWVNFDAPLVEYRRSVTQHLAEVGLDPTAIQQGLEFHDARLRHHVDHDAPLPPAVKDLYAELGATYQAQRPDCG